MNMLDKQCLFAVILTMCTIVNSLKKPEEISDEMYCLGCEVTVKELDFILKHKPTRGMGETVTRALARVCDMQNFNKYDVDAKKVLEVCKHIKGDEGMEAVLITEYGRKHATGKKTTYLDMTQMICGTVLRACKTTEHLDGFGDDGGISYDPVTEDFYVQQGQKVRIPHPVNTNDVYAESEEADVSQDSVMTPADLKVVEAIKTADHPSPSHDHQEL